MAAAGPLANLVLLAIAFIVLKSGLKLGWWIPPEVWRAALGQGSFGRGGTGQTFTGVTETVLVPDPCRNFLLLPKNIGGDTFHIFFNILYRNRI